MVFYTGGTNDLAIFVTVAVSLWYSSYIIHHYHFYPQEYNVHKSQWKILFTYIVYYALLINLIMDMLDPSTTETSAALYYGSIVLVMVFSYIPPRSRLTHWSMTTIIFVSLNILLFSAVIINGLVLYTRSQNDYYIMLIVMLVIVRVAYSFYYRKVYDHYLSRYQDNDLLISVLYLTYSIVDHHHVVHIWNEWHRPLKDTRPRHPKEEFLDTLYPYSSLKANVSSRRDVDILYHKMRMLALITTIVIITEIIRYT